jgi:hypothetical protein
MTLMVHLQWRVDGGKGSRLSARLAKLRVVWRRGVGIQLADVELWRWRE